MLFRRRKESKVDDYRIKILDNHTVSYEEGDRLAKVNVDLRDRFIYSPTAVTRWEKPLPDEPVVPADQTKIVSRVVEYLATRELYVEVIDEKGD